MKEHEEIRDLARQIERLAQDHDAWSMCYEVVYSATGHLRAISQYMEMREKCSSLEQQIELAKRNAHTLTCALESERGKSVIQKLKELFFRDLIEARNDDTKT